MRRIRPFDLRALFFHADVQYDRLARQFQFHAFRRIDGREAERIGQGLANRFEHRNLHLGRTAHMSGKAKQPIESQPCGLIDMLGQSQRVLRSLQSGSVQADI